MRIRSLQTIGYSYRMIVVSIIKVLTTMRARKWIMLNRGDSSIISKLKK